jgi:hypothetical protein
MGHYYLVQTTTRNWADAKTFAESLTWFGMQGHLATVESTSEHVAIQAMIDNSDHWIGGSDAATEGSWKWLSGQSNEQAISTFFWAAGEPSRSANEHCLSYFNDKWYDDVCTRGNKYLVEFECTPGSTCARMLCELIVPSALVFILPFILIVPLFRVRPISTFSL